MARFLFTIFFTLLLSACSHILRQPVSDQKGAWHLELKALRDGPNGVRVGGQEFVSESGTHFLWAFITLKNETAQRRRFNWRKCDLDSQMGLHIPSLVMPDQTFTYLLNHLEIIDAHTQVERKVIFAYPNGELPTRLNCGKMELPLELDP